MTVFELKTIEKVETVTASGIVEFPYIPGLLSFHESPILLKAFEKIKSNLDMFILDAQGIALPLKSAWRLIWMLPDKPSIGCAKTRLIGNYDETGKGAGCYSHLTAQKKVVGTTLRTRKNVEPVLSIPAIILIWF